MDKFLNAMKLNGDEDDYYDDDYYDEDGQSKELPARKESPSKDESVDEVAEEKQRRSTIRSFSAGRARRTAVAANSMEICAIKPTSMEDTREVTDTLLENRTVVLNLEGLDVDLAQRIVDFVSGSCYAIKGNLQKISRYIFIITPSSVDISGDFQEMIGGTFGDTTAG